MSKDTTESTDSTTTETETQTFKIGEKEYTPDQINEAISKAEDYTRKTMSLAEEKGQLQAEKEELADLLHFKKLWENPDNRQGIVESFAKQAGIQIGGQAVTQPADWDEMTPNEKKLYNEIQARDRKIEAVNQNLGEVKGLLGKLTERDKQEGAIAQARASLKSSLGVDVSADDLREAVKSTKVNDPEAAWLKANSTSVAKAFAEKGAAGAVEGKPNTPTGGSKTFDPYDPGLSSDDVTRMLEEGYIASSGPLHLLKK